ncbi:rhomboid family intramembrane serine protease [Niabella sp. CC-SYL272]|uniref:rhomboid family intramembrane serine protease n=1 Tax=Niabella agricola TaxID=2891571 RepID=UPI001F3B1677|nr:rhomboid family intramembrane serine protease [Niabella agricola]MCF3112065.1 rhomboid family intramembrane serine protease [Niabella agricola]
MKGLSDKLRIIYKPFLLIGVGFILIYTLLNWLLFIKAAIPLKEDIIEFWLPFGLPWIPILIWLRPRIKLLNFKNDNAGFGYQFLASIVIAIPTIIAQQYLVTATGKLTQLDNIGQIEKFEKTKYYALKNYYIDKDHIAIQNTATVTGKHNENFNMLIYVAMPVLITGSDTLKTENLYWLGKRYFERISNRLSEQEKDDKYKAFAEKAENDFEREDFSKFAYLEVIGNTDDHNEYNNALKKLNPNASENNVFFEAKAGSFASRNGKKLSWVLGSFIIGAIVWLLLLLFPKFNNRRLKQFKSGAPGKDSDLKDVLALMIPKQDFFITPLIIDLNILIYLVMVFSGLGFISFKTEDLIHWGANFRPLTTDGQWWRLLTCTFLHGGLLHILANMYGLLFVGILLEPLLGRWKFLFIYLVTGILGSIASIWWYDATVSVGASGAIFGLYGCFLACLLLKVFPPDFGRTFLTSTLVFVGFNLLMGVTGGIDNAAHIGGLLSGFLLGCILAGSVKRKAVVLVANETNEGKDNAA